jgi:hypothetical protein
MDNVQNCDNYHTHRMIIMYVFLCFIDHSSYDRFVIYNY